MTQPVIREPRGEDTRSRLIDAGVRLYAEYGREAVSTRQIAREAGVNVAAMAYHFGGKDGFYRAILEQLVAETEPAVGPAIEHLHQGIAAAGGNRDALAILAAGFISGMLKAFIPGERARWRSALVLREYTQPSEAFSILYEGRIEPLHRAVTGLAAAATGRLPDDPESIIQAHAVMGQIMVFAIARVVLWKRLDWDSYGTDHLDKVVSVVTHSVLASLGLPTGTTLQS